MPERDSGVTCAAGQFRRLGDTMVPHSIHSIQEEFLESERVQPRLRAAAQRMRKPRQASSDQEGIISSGKYQIRDFLGLWFWFDSIVCWIFWSKSASQMMGNIFVI